jgi:hypothetical protein
MEATGRRNNLFRVLDSVESATIVGTSRRPGQTVSRARGITEKTTFVHGKCQYHNTPFSCARVRPRRMEDCLENSRKQRAFGVGIGIGIGIVAPR